MSRGESFPLKKYSFVTTTQTQPAQSKFPWTHCSRPDLKVALESIAAPNHHSLSSAITIYQGTESLERISLDDLAYQANIDAHKFQSVPVADALRTVLVIVKKPFLAIRYLLPTHKTRRIQLSFFTDAGYDAVLGALINRRVSVQDKSDQRQLRDQPVYQQAPNLYALPTGSGNDNIRHDHAFLQLNNTGGARNETVDRNSTQLELCQLQPSGNDGSGFVPNRVSYDVVEPADVISRPLGILPTPFNTNIGHQNRNTIQNSLGTAESSLRGESRLINSNSQTLCGPLRELDYAPYHYPDPLRRSLFRDASRPISAPAIHTSPKDMLPPPRPFLFGRKEDEKGVSTENATIRFKDDAHNQEKTSMKTATQPLSSEKRHRQLRARNKSNKAPTNVAKNENPQSVNCSAVSEANETPISRPSSALSDPPPQIGQNQTKRTKHKVTKAYLTAAVQTSPRQVKDTAPGLSTSSSNAITPMGVAEEWQKAVEVFIAGHSGDVSNSRLGGIAVDPSAHGNEKAGNRASKPVSSLSEYASRPVVERRAAINDMIVELILDPGFEALCEDVEGAWKRIGLGM